MKNLPPEYRPLVIAWEVEHSGSLQPYQAYMGNADSESNDGQLFDVRALYLPFADILADDPSKVEIKTGLGKLGLLSVTPDDFKGMLKPDREDYAIATLHFGVGLHRRQRLLKTTGQIEGDALQSDYPGADEKWAADYSSELDEFRQVLGATSLFKEMTRMQDSSPRIRSNVDASKLPFDLEIRRHGTSGKLDVAHLVGGRISNRSKTPR
jgi:hypothetical protein